MKKIEFKKGKWEDEFQYVKSYRFNQTVSFIQEDNYIRNNISDKFADGYEYINISTKNKYKTNTKITTHLSFESYGAPMITFCEHYELDSVNKLRFNIYYEIVIFEDGINIWYLWKENNTCKWTKLDNIDLKLQENTIHELSVTILNDGLQITINNQDFFKKIPNLPKEFYIGVGACENINKIYDLIITE